MQRLRALAWLFAAGLGALALAYVLGGDDPLPPLAAPAADVPAEPAPTQAAPERSEGPKLGSVAKAEAALRRLREELRPRGDAGYRTVAQLARTPSWIRFLATWLNLKPAKDDAEHLARIQEAFAAADGPVTRQNLIFLAALALPLEVAQPWLQQLATGEDAADAEDALVALAFTGEPGARSQFERLARSPEPVNVRRIVDYYREHDAMTRRNDDEMRAVMRSYRAVEAYLREPYFKMVAYIATSFSSGKAELQSMLGWTDRSSLTRREELALLEAWLARYPGHPGSDDVANRLARYHVEDGDLMEAARWFSRAAVLPDQDLVYSSARSLAGLCEIDLTPEQVLALSEDEGLSTPNRRFLQYVWLRRLAAERGFATALREMPAYVRREPSSEVASAWEGRWGTPVPKGLDSGVTPLPAKDPLRRGGPQAGWVMREGPAADDWDKGGRTTSIHDFGIESPFSKKFRLQPWPEVVHLDRTRLPVQMRAWETLAELERRTALARGDARADLLYKQAAVFYHDRDALFPLYGWHNFNFSSVLHGSQRRGSLEASREANRRAREHFETTSLSYVRAMALFDQIEREHPHWAGLDKVLFSQGLVWRKLVDYKPSRHHVYWWQAADDKELHAIRQTVRAFERLVQRFPESPLADDAAAAVAWWRRARPTAFRR